MENLLSQHWFIGVCGAVLGWAIAKLGGVLGDNDGTAVTSNYTTEINSLKAQVNVAHKERDIAQERFSELEKTIAEQGKRIHDYESALEARNEQFEQTRTDLKDAVAKTGELRRELVERAEDSVRATVHARDVENELDLLQRSGDGIDAELGTLATVDFPLELE